MPVLPLPRRVVTWTLKITNNSMAAGAYMVTIHVQRYMCNTSTAVQAVCVETSLHQDLSVTRDGWFGVFSWQRVFTVVRPVKRLPQRKRQPTPKESFMVAYSDYPHLAVSPLSVQATARVITVLPLVVQASVRQLRSYDVLGV